MNKWPNRIVQLVVTLGSISGLFLGANRLVLAESPQFGSDTSVNYSKSESSNEKQTVPLQLLGINDFHGALNTSGSFYDDQGIKTSNTGTAALLAGYLNQAQAGFASAHPQGHTLRVQSGDMVGASPAVSSLLQDEPTIKALNQMNIAIGTLGNHEFDEGLAEFQRIMTGTTPTTDPYGILADYPREASKTEIIIGNVIKKGTAERPEIPFGWKPYTIQTVGTGMNQVKVGFIGVVTTEIPNLVLKQHYQEYEFLDEAQTIVYYADKLRAQGVQAIVVLAHVPATSKQEQVFGEAKTILDKVNQTDPDNSVDVFFAGHNHQYTNGIVQQTRVVQSTSQGKGYIDVQGELNPETQDFVSIPGAVVRPIDPKGVAAPLPDETVMDTVEDAQKRVATVTNKKIGTSKEAGAITREVNDSKESPLGNLITDGQVAMALAQDIPVDFAMTNNGGIRADLTVGDGGEITWGSAQAVQPFGNILQVVEMTGTQIKQVLNEQYDQAEQYFLQVSGLKYTYKTTGNSEQPYEVNKVYKANGDELVPTQSYLVVINDFLYGGGDGFSSFTQAKLVNAIKPDTETFIEFIESKEQAGETIEGKIEGRKQLVDAMIPTEPEIPDEAELIANIKKATIFDPFYKGDVFLRGVTLPNLTIQLYTDELSQKEDIFKQPSKANLVTQADAQGIIKINVSSLNLTTKQTMTAVVSKQQQQVAFTVELLEKTVASSAASTIASSQLSTAATTSSKGKTLPNTGEEQAVSVQMIGILFMLSSLISMDFRKKRSNR